MKEVRLSDDAEADLAEGFWFYERQDPGLGGYFRSTLLAEISRISVSAGIHRIAFREFHCMHSRVFPFAVYYTLDSEEAVVVAVVDQRRSTYWIRRRLAR